MYAGPSNQCAARTDFFVWHQPSVIPFHDGVGSVVLLWWSVDEVLWFGVVLCGWWYWFPAEVILGSKTITSKLRFQSELATTRRFAKRNHQVIFVDFCPVGPLHWESCFPCGDSRFLNPDRNFAVFLAKCVFNFPKKGLKFWERVN